jgi:hypothetical protein
LYRVVVYLVRLCLAELLLKRCDLFLFNLLLFLLLALELNGKLVRTSDGNVLGTEVAEHMLEHLLDNPAATVVEDHDGGHGNLEFGGERNKLQLLVDFRNELGSAGECDSSDHDDTVVHALVLLDGLTERTTLVVDGKGGDLLDQLKKVDGGVEKRRFKLALEIDVGLLGLGTLNISGNVDQSDNVDGELSENGTDDVRVEDVGLRSLLGKCFDGLKDGLVMIERRSSEIDIPWRAKWRGSRHSSAYH